MADANAPNPAPTPPTAPTPAVPTITPAPDAARGPGRPRGVRPDETAEAQKAQVHDVAAVLAQAINLAQNAPKAPAVTRTEGIDEGKTPGGCYLVGERYVNAWGDPVDPPEDAEHDPLNVKRNAANDKLKASQDRGEGFDQHGNPVSDDAKARVKVRQ